jgi:isopentenyldiphosphate isomerase
VAKPKKLSPEQAQERALMELIAKELGVHTDSEGRYRHSNESLLSQIHYRAKKYGALRQAMRFLADEAKHGF